MFEKIKKQLQITKGPKDWDLEYDICMKCGRRLENKKYSTWKEHQDRAHKPTLKEKRKMFFAKHPILTVMVFMVGVLIILPSLEGPLNQGVYLLDKVINPKSNMLDNSQLATCTKQAIDFKQNLYKEKSVSANDLQTLNDLMNNCNLSLRVSQVGPSLFNDDLYKPIDTTQPSK